MLWGFKAFVCAVLVSERLLFSVEQQSMGTFTVVKMKLRIFRSNQENDAQSLVIVQMSCVLLF